MSKLFGIALESLATAPRILDGVMGFEGGDCRRESADRGRYSSLDRALEHL